MKPDVKAFHDEPTGSIQYVVSDPVSARCAIIDPVLDFDRACGRFTTNNADAILDFVKARGLVIDWILDTHPHADHMSAAHYLHGRTGAPTAIGARVTQVQRIWQERYDLPELHTDGRQWTRLLGEGDVLTVGALEVSVINAPGHTLATVIYRVGDAAFINDTLFMPDSGTARTDFPGGSAEDLWQTIGAIRSLPAETRLFTGHDYRPQGRAPAFESSLAEQQANIHLAGRDQQQFVNERQARDRTLPLPNLMLMALQVNLDGGRWPRADAAGRRFLKLPVEIGW
ncbi:MBL fold metallo-hydrolase [Rhizobium sp. SAFR-030]|jgi:glyoxylase-like metal-dependent hydrolase (beta-lactamase superfamily II)|uniref:MBL fold metallo-hydrolase n=1 Tax=Rhizobium sp. SAFR-030 TaxID=3387277 RepID=UPI003F7F9986